MLSRSHINLLSLSLVLASPTAFAVRLDRWQTLDANSTDWFMQAQHGVFTHYLDSLQNNPASPNSLGQSSSWNECVNVFDADAYAASAALANARYAFITMMQGTRFMIAPNDVYSNLTGYAAGEACSTRDLVIDLAAALAKRNIKLMLYWTGDGPHLDPQAASRMGWSPATPDVFVQRWASVLEEYAVRYGSLVHGWWVDGCYQRSLNYTDAKLTLYRNAILKGNPNAIFAFNNGVSHPITRTNSLEDYTCGESDDFVEIPKGRFVADGDQWHTLGFLGTWWAANGTRYSSAYLRSYASQVAAQQV